MRGMAVIRSHGMPILAPCGLKSVGVSLCEASCKGINTYEFAMTGEDDTVTVVVAATLTVECGVDLD